MRRLETKYQFMTNEFGVSDAGIHLLRSRFNYRTIKFSEINAMKIGRGMELHNWALIFLIGAVLIVAGVMMSIGTVQTLWSHGPSGGWSVIPILFIPFVGAYFVYNSVQVGTIMTIDYKGDSNHKLPLRTLIKDKKINEFNALMREKLGNRFRVTE